MTLVFFFAYLPSVEKVPAHDRGARAS
jgi:hypothetical protein